MWRHTETLNLNGNVRFIQMNLNHPNVVFFESSPDEWRWIIRSKDGVALARCTEAFPSMGEAQDGYEEFLKVMRDPKTNKIVDAA